MLIGVMRFTAQRKENYEDEWGAGEGLERAFDGSSREIFRRILNGTKFQVLPVIQVAACVKSFVQTLFVFLASST